MSIPSSLSNTVPGAAEKEASAAQPAKQGRWGWPLRSSVDVSKPSSRPSRAGSGPSAPTSSLPVVSGGESRSLSQPDTAAPKVSAVLPSPKPTRANSANLARILDREAEQASEVAKPPRTSISSERPLQPQLPFARPDGLNLDISADAAVSVGTQTPPNTKPVPPVTGLKSPKRTWPPVETRKQSQDSINKEDAPFSSSRKASASTLSTRRSSRNLPAWPPVSSASSDARDVRSNAALSPLSSRKSIGPEDNKPIQDIRDSTYAEEAPLPSSPVKSEADGVLSELGPHTARIPEAIQPPQEPAEQRRFSQIPGSFPNRSISTLGDLASEKADGVTAPLGSPPPLSSVPAISESVRSGGRDSEERTVPLTSDATDIPEANPRTAQYETEQNPWDDESILKLGEARQIPAEPRLASDSSLHSSLSKRGTGLDQPETQIPIAARKGSKLTVEDSEPSALEHPKSMYKGRVSIFLKLELM